jgi:hypothetical protein
MQTIDILRDERVQLSMALQLHERAMPGIGRGVPCWMIDTALPRKSADFRVRHVVMNVRQLFRLGILRPHALWTSEIWNTRLGRDPGAGERDHAPR